MKTINGVAQGSAAWHAHRAKSRNASDAAAAMGLSVYKTRSQLLQEKATGITEGVTPEKQRLFDKGHAAEAAARTIAEEIIGEELFPVTATDDDGYLSASFDGLTMMGDTCWECKLWNEEKAGQVFAGEIPEADYWQVVQQLIVSGANRCLYMVTDGTPEKTQHCWVGWSDVEPDDVPALIANWRQFDEDLKTYEYVAPKAVAVAEAMESLPAVSVRLDGQIAIASNLPEFGIALRSFIEKIPASPTTDQDFANCEGACKALKKAEDTLEASEAHALAQIVDVESMRRMVADLRNLARSTRLASEKLVAARKESLRVEILTGGKAALEQHIQQINQTFGGKYQLPAIAADFAGAIKGKRTLTSMQDAVDTALANAKIEANRIADGIRINMESLRAHSLGYAALFPDSHVLVLKAYDDLQAVISSRISEHKAAEAKKEEAQRERIRLEEEQKARDKIALEAKQQAEEAARIAREDERKRNSEAMQKAQTEAKPEPSGLDFSGKKWPGKSSDTPKDRADTFDQALEIWARSHCINETAMFHLRQILHNYGKHAGTEAA